MNFSRGVITKDEMASGISVGRSSVVTVVYGDIDFFQNEIRS